MAGPDPSHQMALQGAYYNQQQPVYSLEEMQLLQQSLLYAQQQGQAFCPTTREGMVSPMALGLSPYQDASKFKGKAIYPTNPFAAQQQVQQLASSQALTAVPNGAYMTMGANGGLVPYAYMPYMTIPGAYPQYAAAPGQALVQIPTNSHNLAAAAAMPQYSVQPKLVYGAASGYNENVTPEYKTTYTPAPSVRPVKMAGPAAADLTGFKIPREKTYQKPGFPSGTPPPPYRPELAPPASSLSPPSAYPPMIVSHMSPQSQFQTPLVHPQLNQEVDGLGLRRTVAAIPNKGATRGGYSRSTWRPN